MNTENPGLKIFNNWIKENNHIYKFTKDSKYDDILPVMFPTISAQQQTSVLKAFKEKNLIRPDTILTLKEITKKKKTEEKLEQEKEKEIEKLAREEEREENEKEHVFWYIEKDVKQEQRNKSLKQKKEREKMDKKLNNFQDCFDKNELPERDIKSLKNACKKVLNINENVPVLDVVDFLEKNEIFDLDSLFLVNFEKKPWVSLSSDKIHEYCGHEILGFKEMSGKYGKYYLIYCKISITSREYEYMILFSNKKIAEKIDNSFWRKTKEVDKGVKFFKDYSIYFEPEELDYFKGICYRKVYIY